VFYLFVPKDQAFTIVDKLAIYGFTSYQIAKVIREQPIKQDRETVSLILIRLIAKAELIS
jgi:hypothetical protein